MKAEDVDAAAVKPAEPLVYDQNKPSDAYLVRDLPGGLFLDDAGIWHSNSRWWLGLFLPALAVLGNAACWVMGH